MKQLLIITAVLLSLSASAQKSPVPKVDTSKHRLVLDLNEEQVGKVYQLFGVGMEKLPESETLSAKQANILYPFGDSIQRVIVDQILVWHPQPKPPVKLEPVAKDSTGKKN